MKKIISLCLLTQLSFVARAEDLQFWNKLDIPVYYTVGNRTNAPTQAGLQKLPAFNAKQENASKSPVIKVDNSQFPQLLVVQEVNGAPGKAGMLYEFKTADGKPIKSGKKLYVRLIQEGNSPKFTKQTYVLNNIDDADISSIAGKGSKPFSLAATQQPAPSPAAGQNPSIPSTSILIPATEQERLYQQLMEAIKSNNIEAVKKALTTNVKFDGETTRRMFLETVAKGDPRIAQVLISSEYIPVDLRKDIAGTMENMVVYATDKKDFGTIKTIYNAGITTSPRITQAALDKAAMYGNAEALKEFLGAGIGDIDAITNGLTPLERAMRSNKDAYEKTKLLIEAGANLEIILKPEELKYAIGQSKVQGNGHKILQLLTAAGLNLDDLFTNAEAKKAVEAGKKERAAYSRIVKSAQEKREAMKKLQ